MTDDEKQQEIVHVLELVTNALAENTPQKQKERKEEIRALHMGISVLLFPMFIEYINNQRNYNLSLNMINIKDMDFNRFIQNLFERFDFIRKNTKDNNNLNHTDEINKKYDDVWNLFVETAKNYKFY